jgi:hypothetical protein
MSTTRQEDGLYHLESGTFPTLVGSRAMVMHKTAYKTSGNLTIDDLKRNKHGRIAGFFAKKGSFGYVRKTAKNRK